MTLTQKTIKEKVKTMEEREKRRLKEREKNPTPERKPRILPVTPGVYPSESEETTALTPMKASLNKTSPLKKPESTAAKKSKPAVPSVNPDKFNRALADVALDKMGYPNQGCPPNDPKVADLAKKKFIEMDCPLISKTWDCNKAEKGKELEHRFYERGKEFQCISGGFVNCPSYRLYFNFRIGNRSRQQGKEKGAKRKGT